MLRITVIKVFLLLFVCSLFLLFPSQKAFARIEISLFNDGNKFDQPTPPYRIAQHDPPVSELQPALDPLRPPEYVVVHPGTPIDIWGTVYGCTDNIVATAYPMTDNKKIINNAYKRNDVNFNPFHGLKNLLGSNLFHIIVNDPGNYYIYAKCGKDGEQGKYENIDIKYVEVYNAKPSLPPPAPAGPAVLGGGYCPDGESIDTAIGCVPVTPTRFVGGLMKFAIGIGGGIALLIMALASIQMVTSQGNPEALKKAHSQFTSAIIGLLFIIFSALIMQIIGFDLLNIPGFSK